jgi:hypothetical protein
LGRQIDFFLKSSLLWGKKGIFIPECSVSS